LVLDGWEALICGYEAFAWIEKPLAPSIPAWLKSSRLAPVLLLGCSGGLHHLRDLMSRGVKSEELQGFAPKRLAIVRFEPVERGVHLRIEPQRGTAFDEERALFWVLHRAAGFRFIRPGFDFSRRLGRAVGLQPGADLLIIRRSLHGGFELLAGNALEAEEHIVQRTIVMIFAQRSRQAGAALIDGAAGDGEPGEAFARAVRGLFG